jgi:hypothetical protein
MKLCIASSVCEPLAALVFGTFFNGYLTYYFMSAMNAAGVLCCPALTHAACLILYVPVVEHGVCSVSCPYLLLGRLFVGLRCSCWYHDHAVLH